MKCSDSDIAIKSFFLGPQAENSEWVESNIHDIFSRWFSWRKDLYPQDGKIISLNDQKNSQFVLNQKKLHKFILQLLKRFENEIPKHSPRYIGHMFSEISLPALLGHIITLLHNPNNISSESARSGLIFEKEAIAMLMQMVGFDPKMGAGHFTSGGTVANLEAMYRAKKKLELKKNNYSQLNEPVILVPASCHYSWPKGASLMGFSSHSLCYVELDQHGKMCATDLEKKIEKIHREKKSILMLVSVVGSTELGSIDPIHKIQKIIESWQKRGVFIWHHIDAAFGGFFATLKNMKKNCEISSATLSALNSLHMATSMTIDPHKLGYVPYSSGAFLVKEKKNYFLASENPPYIQFDMNFDPGPYTIEGSRSATGAVATWFCGKSIGFHERGYGRILNRTIRTRKKLEKNLAQIHGVQILPGSETNILCFAIARPKQSLSKANKTTNFYIQNTNKHNHFFVSKTTIYLKKYPRLASCFLKKWSPILDDDKIVCVRLCLMNPFLDSKEGKSNFIKIFCKDLKTYID